MNRYQKFMRLHQQAEPLLIGNVWDCQSAVVFEKQGYKSIGTSSAAIASSLGYEDGEQIDFDGLNATVKRIVSKITIPFTVDLEGGYSRSPDQIIKHILALHKVGVVGINLEDSVVNEGRKIRNVSEFGEIIQTIKTYIQKNNIEIFLNIRTDAYLMGLENPLEETISRIETYAHCGADGVFVPCITTESDITQVVRSTSLPINVMAMPGLPTFETLKKCGVKRMSMGPFMYTHMNEQLKNVLDNIEEAQSFRCLFTIK